MFAAVAHRFSGRGHGPMPGGGGAAVQMELAHLKSLPMLNPHFGMVVKYLDCLNRLMDSLLITHGHDAGRVWLIEVQTLIRMLQKRVYQRMPLNGTERQAIVAFASYWRQMHRSPYMMGRPEAQLVLIALTEFASI